MFLTTPFSFGSMFKVLLSFPSSFQAREGPHFREQTSGYRGENTVRHGIDSRGCFKRERSSLVASVVETIVVLVEFVVVFQTLHAQRTRVCDSYD